MEVEGQRGHLYKNWAATETCEPELFFQPESIEQLKAIIKKSRDDDRHLRVIGSGASPSDINCTDEYMVSMAKMNKLLDVNSDKCTVTVEAGMTFDTLNKLLRDNGLSMSVLPVISFISVGGAISTAVHGTGIKYGVLSSYVLELTLMTCDGELVNCSRTVNTDVFRAACCSLGSLGVITSVKLQCESLFNLTKTSYPCMFDDVLENLDIHLKASDHFDITWFPYTNKVKVAHSKRSTSKVQSHKSWFFDQLLGIHILQLLLWLSSFLPFIQKFINQLCVNLYAGPCTVTDWSPNVFTFDCRFSQYVSEWAIPREKITVAMKDLQTWILTNKYPAHMFMETRFTKADDIFLSTAYGRETAYINIISFRPYGKDVPHAEYFAAFETIMRENGGRPHWAKTHPMKAADLKEVYPAWEQFNNIRRRLDPRGLFMNYRLKQIFE